MDKARKQQFDNVIYSLLEAKNELVEIQKDEIADFDMLPVCFQLSSRGDNMQEWISFIDKTVMEIYNVIGKIQERIKS